MVSDEVLAERRAKWQPQRAEGYNRLSGTLRCTCYTTAATGADPSGSDSIDSEGEE